jgi:hypothetical protein
LKFLSINRTIKADFNLGSIPNAGIELISGAIRESDLVFAFAQKMVRGRAKPTAVPVAQGSGSADPNLPYVHIGRANSGSTWCGTKPSSAVPPADDSFPGHRTSGLSAKMA